MAMRSDFACPLLCDSPQNARRSLVGGNRIGNQIGRYYMKLIEKDLEVWNTLDVIRSISVQAVFPPVVFFRIDRDDQVHSQSNIPPRNLVYEYAADLSSTIDGWNFYYIPSSHHVLFMPDLEYQESPKKCVIALSPHFVILDH